MATCRLCNSAPVGQNGEVCDDCMSMADFQPKANLVLEGSEKDWQWGVVKLTPGTINLPVLTDSVIVGTWTRLGEGTYWVALMEPIKAIQDRFTLLALEIARRREQGLPLMLATPKERAPRPKHVEEPVPKLFADLRAKLGG